MTTSSKRRKVFNLSEIVMTKWLEGKANLGNKFLKTWIIKD